MNTKPSNIILPKGSNISPFFSPSPADSYTLPSSNYGMDGSVATSHGILAQLIIDSQLYQLAYQEFSSDPEYGSQFLSELQLIPYSYDVVDENFWDEFVSAIGASSKYEKAITDSFNAAMKAIQALVSSYHSFINSLPESQVQQLRDAGYNAAVTGEGLTGSSLDTSGVSGPAATSPSSSQYSNEALSQGITSFVEFIGSVATLTTTGVNSASVLGLLDLAEREGYNKQEVHDLFMAQYGNPDSRSPYRILLPSGTVADIAEKAKADMKVSRAESEAAVRAIDRNYEVPVGSEGDPNGMQTTRIMSGVDILNDMSGFKLVTRMADGYRESINSAYNLYYADVLGRLEGEARLAGYGSEIAEGEFSADFFNSRSGVTEGSNETSLSTALLGIRQVEQQLRQFDAWLAEYKQQTLYSWGENLANHPYLAPYMYKALFDFDMEDTIWHGSRGMQITKYGLDSVEKVSNAFANFLAGFTKIKPPTIKPRTTTTTSQTVGPKGGVTTTRTQSITE